MYSDGLTLHAVPYFLNVELNILPTVLPTVVEMGDC